jgi:hypothetical protein
MIYRRSCRFNRCKIIKSQKNETHNKATRTMRGSVMLLLLRSTFSEAVSCCAFDKIREPRQLKRGVGNNYRFAGERKMYKRKFARRLKNIYAILLFTPHLKVISQIECSYTAGLLCIEISSYLSICAIVEILPHLNV